MSSDEALSSTTPDGEEGRSVRNSPHISWSDSFTKAHNAIESLSSIISDIPHSLSNSETPANCLLHNQGVASQIIKLLLAPDSGAGDNSLCRWLYDTFQTNEPDLHLVVLRFLPMIAGVYLSRAALHKPLAGFECVLLALYAHETTSRNGQSVTVNIPDLTHPSVYHESNNKQIPKNSAATELNIAVISPSLEPYGTVRSTRRARIVGVALEFYYSRISELPVGSKIEFCEFCKIWAGQDGDAYRDEGVDQESSSSEEESSSSSDQKEEKKKGRIILPWELLQPVLRILGHCLMGPKRDKVLSEAACGACRSLYARALHDINPKAILATGSLLRLSKMASSLSDDVDHTELTLSNVITLH